MRETSALAGILVVIVIVSTALPEPANGPALVGIVPKISRFAKTKRYQKKSPVRRDPSGDPALFERGGRCELPSFGKPSVDQTVTAPFLDLIEIGIGIEVGIEFEHFDPVPDPDFDPDDRASFTTGRCEMM
jgi:hypothetical protein